MPSAPSWPPGWYPDPTGPGLRWWDGNRWTEHPQGGAAGRDSAPSGGRQPLLANKAAETEPEPGSARRGRILKVAVVFGIAGLLFVSAHKDKAQRQSTVEPSASPSAPWSTSQPKRYDRYGKPVPAPANDPCWRETEEAVELSPEDYGQSAMPQECIERGF